MLQYPSGKAYDLPKKNVLVISCIDLRLTDNLVHFLHFDNLHNRYDHFTLAGASLLCTQKQDQLKPGLFKEGQERKEGSYPSLRHAKQVLLDHVQIAIDLHKIEDVYIVEHEDCGAYREFLIPSRAVFSTPEEERECHWDFAKELADELCETHKKQKLNAHCFFIDLRGNVELLYTRPAGNLPTP
ncbi:MAG: hypothetical protein ICV83_11360 [Cytophagales bacterium]|nr:hypothetical protein [Cytophagales bacterium]